MTKYPFLPKYRKEVKQELRYLPQTFTFINRILESENFLATYESDFIDVNVFFNAAIILKHISDKYITKKFVQNYCKRIESYLLHDTPIEVFIFIDISFKRIDDRIVMPMESFMKFKQNVIDKHVALKEQIVKDGTVSMDVKVFAYISRRQLESKLLEQIENMKELPEGIIPAEYNEKIEQIKEGYSLKLRSNENKPLPMIHKSNDIPPCILSLSEKANEKHDLNHPERLLLATYLLRMGYEEDYIKSFFEKLSDYKEKTTMRHIKSLKGYKTAACEKIRKEGLCKQELDTKNRCGKITTPIFY